MKKMIWVGAVFMATVVSAEYVEFSGMQGRGTTGSLVDAASWPGGVLPSGSSTGLVTDTLNVWTGTAWNNLAVRQIGGAVKTAGSFSLRGGLKGSGIATAYEIDDPRTDYDNYVNLDVGELVMWSQHGEPMKLNLFSGHVETKVLSLNAANAVINLRNGLLHVEQMKSGKATVNMLSGGSGKIVVDELACSMGNALRLNFESGSNASFSVGAKADGVSSAGIWEWLIKHGQISIDGVVTTDDVMFLITKSGNASSIELLSL